MHIGEKGAIKDVWNQKHNKKKDPCRSFELKVYIFKEAKHVATQKWTFVVLQDGIK